MKINNKSKVTMNIFHQARRRIALIAGLLGQFADEQRTKSESTNFIFGFSNFHTVQSMILCESLKQTSQIYDLMMVAYSVSTQ